MNSLVNFVAVLVISLILMNTISIVNTTDSSTAAATTDAGTTAMDSTIDSSSGNLTTTTPSGSEPLVILPSTLLIGTFYILEQLF